MATVETFTVDGQTLTREEANLLLIELNRMPERPGLAAKEAATAVKRAILEPASITLSHRQATAIRRAIEGIRIKRRNLPTGLADLRGRLTAPTGHNERLQRTDPTAGAGTAPGSFETDTQRSNVA
jgi:hypothetical protein